MTDVSAYNALFLKASNLQEPYPYQTRLAVDPWPDVLEVPTGMGKTYAVVLAWLYKRLNGDSETPRRLVYCLPMRVLVEQTRDVIARSLVQLEQAGLVEPGRFSVSVLMGGEPGLKDASWTDDPAAEQILVGTQDMLLSRALMRGYGMSRYLWPVHFALLHNDAMWVFDEVQLMGAGLPTSTQLDAFRRCFPLAKPSRSLWMSATLKPSWLDTIDFHPHLQSLAISGLEDDDHQRMGDRWRASKQISRLDVVLTKAAGNKAGVQAYLQSLCDAILNAHDRTGQSIVIVNRVARAQQLFRLLRAARPQASDLLIHARFRAAERAAQSERLKDDSPTDRIVVATQAIEAGIDISSKVLVTELAPWPSLVQRFGRCNRQGEHNASGARILWADVEDDAETSPYTREELSSARGKLHALTSASPQDLPPTDTPRPIGAVLRRKDLLDLFNTDPDLSGFDVDVSDYIRDSDQPGIQVFWRDFDEPNGAEPDSIPESRPLPEELCAVSMSQAKGIHKRGAWYWDTLGDDRRTGRWVKLDRNARPGMTLLLRASDGGYDAATGFDATQKTPPVPVIPTSSDIEESAFGGDELSRQNKPVALDDHLGHVAAQAESLCLALGETEQKASVVRAGRWHDLGKVHEVFDATMHACEQAPAGFLAKSPCQGRHGRKFFRHELASMLAWLAQHDGEPNADLIAYLIAAHHGKVRLSLRAMPTESAAAGVKRYARGVWEGDVLPALDFDGEHSDEITLKLALMELGEGAQGASWTTRALGLLERFGPFHLAWLETLVRLADWRASAQEQEAQS